MLRIILKHYPSGSVIVAADGSKQLGELHYTNKTHIYQSESDFKRISVQLNTYGDIAALEEFNRIKEKSNGKATHHN